MRTTQFACYSIHTRTAAISGWPALLAAVDRRLAPFSADTVAAPEFSIDFEAVDRLSAPRQSARGRCVYEFPRGSLTYVDDEQLLIMDVDRRVRAECWLGAGRAHVAIESPREADLWTLSHPVLTVALMELLKRRSLFPVHAAGLALDGRGLLLAGARGAGKSTLTIALAKRGFSFLTDDMVLLAESPRGWQLRAFPDDVDLCDDTLDLFPELRTLREEELPAGWLKRQIRPDRQFGAPIEWTVPARVIVFPSIRSGDESSLDPLSADEALLELAPNVLLTDAAVAQRHFDALAGVVSQCRCYRLSTGRVLDRAVSVLRDVVLT
jgi:hypothetical protein